MAASIPQTQGRSTMPGQSYSRLLHLDLLGVPLLVVQLGLQPDHLLGLPGALVSLAPFLLPLPLMVVQPVAVPLAVQLDVLVLRLWAQGSALSASRRRDEAGGAPHPRGAAGPSLSQAPYPAPTTTPTGLVSSRPVPSRRVPSPAPTMAAAAGPPHSAPLAPAQPKGPSLPPAAPGRNAPRGALVPPWGRAAPCAALGLRPVSVGQERGETGRKGRNGCSVACVCRLAVRLRKVGWLRGSAMRRAPSGAARRPPDRLGAAVLGGASWCALQRCAAATLAM